MLELNLSKKSQESWFCDEAQWCIYIKNVLIITWMLLKVNLLKISHVLTCQQACISTQLDNVF